MALELLKIYVIQGIPKKYRTAWVKNEILTFPLNK